MPIQTTERVFYLLELDDEKFIGATRLIEIDSLFNLRDLGGYQTKDRKIVKWGVFCEVMLLDYLMTFGYLVS